MYPFTLGMYRLKVVSCVPFLLHASKVLFLALSVTFCLFVYEIFPEPLNGFAADSQGRRVDPRSEKFECQGQRLGQGHQGQNRKSCSVTATDQCIVQCAPYAASDV